MEPNCKEMDWEEVANLLNGANIILAKNFNDLTEEHSHLLMKTMQDDATQRKNKKEGDSA
ncbi:MAG: hypothetical protein HOK41_07750 [Nitrospina sp.]|jgi:hypothetical protein|nr:hypothetical protein [Nitrospina sp.]MBT6716146.1 hypothetical protein [Nitrospina sp.]